MLIERDLSLPGGGNLHVYDTGPVGPPCGNRESGGAPAHGEGSLVVLWHHGTPNLGRPPAAPLLAPSTRLGIRWIGYDRPGYGRSTRAPGRDLGSAARYAGAVADALGIERFAAMGHSGGGSHALACAALLPDRVAAAVSIAGLAPRGADGLDWYAGMRSPDALRAAEAGRAAREHHHEAGPDWDPEEFTPEDHEALAGPWSWLHEVVAPALDAGPGGLVDDDLAYVAPWGCDPGTVRAPVLLVHGADDRVVPAAHSEWLARCPGSQRWLSPGDGHVSVLGHAAAALAWLSDRARPGNPIDAAT